jgi:hypothetical protein
MAVDSNGSERSSVRDAHGDVVDSPSGPQLSNQRAIGFRLILMLESTSLSSASCSGQDFYDRAKECHWYNKKPLNWRPLGSNVRFPFLIALSS